MRSFLAPFILSLIALVLTGGCTATPEKGVLAAHESPQDAIIDGVPAQESDEGARSVVMILGPQSPASRISNPHFSVCTGVLIAENVALTAAHCVQPLEDQVALFHDGLIADLGLIGFAAAPAEQRRISKFIVHESFKGQSFKKIGSDFYPQVPYDLALVYFEGARPENSEIAQIAGQSAEEVIKHSLQIYGYGYSVYDYQDIKDRNKAIDRGRESFLTQSPLLTTRREVRLSDKSEDGFILDQRGKSGICYGDSGGPAFIKADGKTWLVGLNSHRTGAYKDDEGRVAVENIENECQYDSFLLRTTTHLKWVREKVAILNSKNCEELPLFRARTADLLNLDQKEMTLTPLGNSSYKAQGKDKNKHEATQFSLTASSSCRIHANQGLVSLAGVMTSLRSNLLSQVRTSLKASVKHKTITQVLLHDRVQDISEDSIEPLLHSLSSQEKWQRADQSWLFENIQLENNYVTTIQGVFPLESLQIMDTAPVISKVISEGIKAYWIVSALEKSTDYRQEIWLRDSNTHEILIVRETVTGE